jgi:hypothetical protein
VAFAGAAELGLRSNGFNAHRSHQTSQPLSTDLDALISKLSDELPLSQEWPARVEFIQKLHDLSILL